MEDIKSFNYLDLEDNNRLTDIKGGDLQDLLYYLNKYYLSLRDELGIDKNNTFGMELEFENADKSAIQEDLIHANLDYEWKLKRDGSLVNGQEIASPVLRDLKVDWKNLDSVCKIVSNHAIILKKAGGHIHIGAQIFNNNKQGLINFLKLWAVYENIIFRFTYGNFVSGRECVDRYAYPVSRKFLKIVDDLEKDDSSSSMMTILLDAKNPSKYQAANFNNITSFDRRLTNNTIEFRCPNGTLDSVIWQNNLNLFIKLIEYAKTNDFNNDIINDRRKVNLDLVSNLNDYNKIYLRQALEFADLVFDNNLDKVYFLRQYLKNYQCSNESLLRAKPFTKTFI